MTKRLKQEPETFDIDSLPIGIEELAKEEGKRIGLRKEKIRIAKNMLNKKMDIGLIEEITGLDLLMGTYQSKKF